MNLRILVLVFVLGIGAIAVGWVYESHLRTKIERADLIIPDNIDYYLTNLHYRAMKTDGTSRDMRRTEISRRVTQGFPALKTLLQLGSRIPKECSRSRSFSA